MLVPEAADATVFSVGVEPNGVPDVCSTDPAVRSSSWLLEDQFRRRADVPRVAAEPGWSLVVDGVDRQSEPRGRRLAHARRRRDRHVAARRCSPNRTHARRCWPRGCTTASGRHPDLLSAPDWATLGRALGPGDRVRRVLDFRTGTLAERVRGTTQIDSIRFSSSRRSGNRRAARRRRSRGRDGHAPDSGGEGSGRRGRRGRRRSRSTAGASSASWPTTSRSAVNRHLIAPAPDVGARGARQRLRAAAPRPPASVGPAMGAGRRRHRRRRRAAAPRALRAVPPHGVGRSTAASAAVGTRGLTGPAYRGHVFWDADVFVLPFLAATHPPAARAMLEYRVRRLGAAQACRGAPKTGRARASPGSRRQRGVDVTPRSGRDRDRTDRPDSHRARSRCTSSATSRGRPRATSGWTGDGVLRARLRARAARRDGAVLGIASARRPRRRAHILRRHRTGRVPRAGRRQHVHQRARPLEPADARPRGRNAQAGSR